MRSHVFSDGDTKGVYAMLVLSRKLGEAVELSFGDVTIAVTVVDIDRGRIRLGFEAPKQVVVMRRELIKKPSQQTQTALPSPVEPKLVDQENTKRE